MHSAPGNNPAWASWLFSTGAVSVQVIGAQRVGNKDSRLTMRTLFWVLIRVVFPMASYLPKWAIINIVPCYLILLFIFSL